MVINPLIDKQNRWIFLASIVVLGFGQFLVITKWLGLAWEPALLDAVVSSVFLAVVTFFIVQVLSFYYPSRGQYYFVVVGAAIESAVQMWIIQGVLNWMIDDPDYSLFINDSLPFRFIWFFSVYAGVMFCSLLWHRLSEQATELNRKDETERMAREAELVKLRQQLQPHFLFNSLNSINALTGSRPEEARKMIQQLSDFLRGTLRREDQQLVTVDEELSYLQLYLDIEQVRFGHRLNVDVNRGNNCTTAKLPPLILQPLLENAIKFGLYGTMGEVHIKLGCEVNGNNLVISLTNPYDDDMQTTQEGTGFGLKSVQRRLFLLYSRTDLLQAEKKEGEFLIKLKIPQGEIQGDNN